MGPDIHSFLRRVDGRGSQLHGNALRHERERHEPDESRVDEVRRLRVAAPSISRTDRKRPRLFRAGASFVGRSLLATNVFEGQFVIVNAVLSQWLEPVTFEPAAGAKETSQETDLLTRTL